VSELHIEVVIAWHDRQRVVELQMPMGSTVADALERVSGMTDFDGADLDVAAVGIFGLVVERTQRLVEGDRVEIYRSLAIDPMTARRRRARRGVNRPAAD
jgi:uncharacterized protein